MKKKSASRKFRREKTSMLSQLCTLVLGLIIFFISINPPDVIWKINMFAFGGLETAFFWVFILGMFWKKANKTGAIWAMAGGTVVYCLTMLYGHKNHGNSSDFNWYCGFTALYDHWFLCG